MILEGKTDYRDTILSAIIASENGKRGEYKYSDLGFYLLAEMVRFQTGLPLDRYLEENFYRPMGLPTMGFNPLSRFPESRIIPTENDTVWRHRLVRGEVLDPGAAMLGGVSGHAGLFSDAFDLAAIMQMLLSYGEYGGKQYLMPTTVREFTKAQFPDNRRGMGFDKPSPVYKPDGPSCRDASTSSFGHSGFTGTYAWADPENGLVYVFLSNRVYPDAGNNKLSQLNIRTDLHQAVYQMLGEVRGN
jgi:CubicO group peptidase (beta-lactamase class C family)